MEPLFVYMSESYESIDKIMISMEYGGLFKIFEFKSKIFPIV